MGGGNACYEGSQELYCGSGGGVCQECAPSINGGHCVADPGGGGHSRRRSLPRLRIRMREPDSALRVQRLLHEHDRLRTGCTDDPVTRLRPSHQAALATPAPCKAHSGTWSISHRSMKRQRAKRRASCSGALQWALLRFSGFLSFASPRKR